MCGVRYGIRENVWIGRSAALLQMRWQIRRQNEGKMNTIKEYAALIMLGLLALWLAGCRTNTVDSSAVGDALEVNTENASAAYQACLENNCDGEPDCECDPIDVRLPADWQ